MMLEVTELASKGIFFIVKVGVVYIDIDALCVDCTGASFVGEDTSQGSLVGDCSSLESGIIYDHDVEREGFPWSMGACKGLVDIVHHDPRSEDRSAVDGQVD